jgi:TonB family protein
MKRQIAFIGLLLLLTCLHLSSQTPVAIPKSPNEYMQRAISLNGLAADGLQPWHIKASYSYFNEAGAVTDSGTIEEWRISSRLYKVSLLSQRYSQTQYFGGNDLRVTGDQNPPSWQLQNVKKYIERPLPEEKYLERAPFQRLEEKYGQIPLDCLRTLGYPVWCFSKDEPAIRLIADVDGAETVLNEISKFNGQYLAKQVSLVQHGKSLFKMKIDTVDYPAQLKDSELQAPADAIEPEKIAISDGMPPLKNIHKQAPVYPSKTKAQGMEGKVRISATIEKDGSVDDLSVVSGPKELQGPCLDAIKKWRYEPYLINGRSVAVATQFSMDFSFER